MNGTHLTAASELLPLHSWVAEIRTCFPSLRICDSFKLVLQFKKKTTTLISLAPHYVEIAIYHDTPTRSVCIFFFSFYLVFFLIFCAIFITFSDFQQEIWKCERYFLLSYYFFFFFSSFYIHSKCSLLEWVYGVKLDTFLYFYDYLLCKSNVSFWSNISIHITWHHWQKKKKNKKEKKDGGAKRRKE